MKRIAPLIVACLLSVCLGKAVAGDPLSPLFQARLEATMAGWQRGWDAGQAATQRRISRPGADSTSFCLGSVCQMSYCLESYCASSTCIGSACPGSACTASSCVGTVCHGSACLGVSLCPKRCDGNDGAAGREGPDYGNLTYTWGPCRDM